MSPWIRCTIFASVAIACGKPSGAPPNGSIDGGDGNPGADAGMDSLDAGADAPIGPLTPEPVDPMSSVCAGLLGFPGPGTIPTDATEMLAGDIDGDGIVDLIYSEPTAFRIAHGNGNGTFAAATTFSVPLNAKLLRLGHLDQDGKPDLVFAQPSASFGVDIRGALNNASGGFGAPQTLYTLSNVSVSQLELVDVNGDGKNDLLALSMYSLQVAVLISSGTGFAAPQLYTVASIQYANQMALGDLTGDGRPDIVVSESAGAVNVLVNNGNGTFANRVAYASPSSSWGVALADANEDGKLDVLVGTAQGNMGSVSVLLNQGAGTFGSAVSYSVAVQGIGSDAPRSLAVADINGDGHVDIGAAYTLDSGATILRGDGTGQFGSPLRYAYDAQAIAFADLQGDARPDMLLLGPHTVTSYLNNATQAPFPTRTDYRFGAGPHQLFFDGARMADLNGDGPLDLIGITSSSTFSASTVMTMLASGNGSFGTAAPYLTPLRAQHSALSDVNNDGRMDVVLMGYGSSAMAQVLLDNADGSLTAATPVTLPQDRAVWALGDVDHDGRRDLVVGDVGPYPAYTSTVRYYAGTGTGSFGSFSSVWTGTYLRGVAAPDLNGDGKRDLVISSYGTSYQVEVLLATGNGTFAPPALAVATSGPKANLFARDVNADGKSDILGIDDDGVVVMLGDGTGALGPPTRTAAQLRAYDAAFADFDGDSHLDVVATGEGTVAVLLGRGDGTFRTPRFYESGKYGRGQISAGDVDGDGRVDILVAGGDDHVSVLYGRCL